jgi:hypothetical protein
VTSSPKWRNTATNSFNIGAGRLPAGIPSTVQRTVSAAMTSGPHCGGRAVLGAANLGCNAVLSACGHVVSVTALRSANVNPIIWAY